MKSFRGKPVLSNGIKPSAAPQNRIHIANLAAALNTFYPVLVNESNEEIPYGTTQDDPIAKGATWAGQFKMVPGTDPAKHPDIHQLVNSCFTAMQEMREFIRTHEELKQQVTVFRDDLTAAYTIAKASGINAQSMEDTVATYGCRWNQAINIIEKLTNATPDTEARTKAAASEYLTAIVPAQKAGFGLTAPIAPVPEPQVDGGGTNPTDKTNG